MKALKIFHTGVLVLLICSSIAMAGDFDWMKDFNITAQADPSGFRARLATRFQIGDAKMSAVIGNVDYPADAYMVFRLGELSNLPPEQVMTEYKSFKGKGWGVIAKNLGIKPGSAEFHTLKNGHDLDSRHRDGYKGKGKDKDKEPKTKGDKNKSKDKGEKVKDGKVKGGKAKGGKG